MFSFKHTITGTTRVVSNEYMYIICSRFQSTLYLFRLYALEDLVFFDVSCLEVFEVGLWISVTIISVLFRYFLEVLCFGSDRVTVEDNEKRCFAVLIIVSSDTLYPPSYQSPQTSIHILLNGSLFSFWVYKQDIFAYRQYANNLPIFFLITVTIFH